MKTLFLVLLATTSLHAGYSIREEMIDHFSIELIRARIGFTNDEYEKGRINTLIEVLDYLYSFHETDQNLEVVNCW